jgi:ubiquitin-protein ligase
MIDQILTLKLKSELEFIKDISDPNFETYVDSTNIFKWYFLIKGKKNTEFSGGYFLGEILYTNEFPIKYPECKILTPNNNIITNNNLDISFSEYHYDPDEISEILYDIIDMIHHYRDLTLPSKNYLALQSIVYNKLHYPELVNKFPRFLDQYGNSPKHNDNIYKFWIMKCSIIDDIHPDIIKYMCELFFYNIIQVL